MDDEAKVKKATYHLYTFLVSKMVSTLGANVYSFAISMYILSITGSSLSFATNILLSVLPRTIFSPIAGVLGDRLPRKWLVLGGQLGQMLTVISVLAYTVSVELSILAIYIATVFISIFSTFTSIAFVASVPNLVDKARIQKAMSFNQISIAISGIGGPVVGGMMYGFVSMPIFLAIYAGAIIVTFILEASMNFELFSEVDATERNDQSFLSSFKEGVTYLKQQKVVCSVLIAVIWLNLFFTCMSVGGSFVLVTTLKMSPKLVGITEAGIALGMLIASIYFASRSNVKLPLLFVKRSTLSLSFVVMLAAVPVLFVFSDRMNFIYYFVLLFLFGLLSVLTNTPLGVLLQTTIEESYRGRIFGILETLAMSMMPLGTIAYGILFDILPAQYLFLVSGVCLMLLVLLLIRRDIIELAHPELKKNVDSLQTNGNAEFQSITLEKEDKIYSSN